MAVCSPDLGYSVVHHPETDGFNSRMLVSILRSAGLLPAPPAAVTDTQDPNIKAEHAELKLPKTLLVAEGNLTKKLMK